MLFESVAHAMSGMGGGAEGGNPIAALLPLVLMFAIFYFLLIRPQQKKQKQHRQYLEGIQKGDYVLTGGGIYGRVIGVDGDKLSVEIAENMTIKVNRNFVSGPAEASDVKEK